MATITELTDNLAYGVDLKNRRIYFGVNLDTAEATESTDFTLSSVEMAVRAMHRMATDYPNKPIELHMSSYGGDTYAMLRLHDEILACPCQVKFIGSGPIMSSASFIMAVCDQRELHPNAVVMVHELTSGGGGKHTDIKIDAAENVRLMNQLCSIYEANSRMPLEFWLDICQRDVYLTASEAVSLGLADRIIEPKKRGNLRKSRQAAMKKDIDAKEMKDLVKSLYERTNRTRIPKLEFNEIKKEAADPHLFVDETKTPEKPVLDTLAHTVQVDVKKD
jgi:ATP-dependent Clp protease protease subunit